jgi:hypothetical protein
MAGTLFGLGLSQQISASGAPLSGALLYVYQENSSTPVETFADFSLTTAQTFPIVADSAGRLPQIWVADGSYRARLTTSAGVEVFDESSVTAIGASSTTTSGSSSSSGTGFITGDMLWSPVAGTRSGWVRCNDRTIGSGASGATERANADTQALFEYLWNNFSNALCPVSGGRGASAEADFNANKTIETLGMRGCTIYGVDDMGNSALGIITVGGSPTTEASFLGADTTSITLATTNLPSHTHGAGTYVADAHTHGAGSYAVGTGVDNGTTVWRAGGDGANVAGGAGATPRNASQATLSLTSGSVTGTSGSDSPDVSGTSGSTGSGTAYVATTISPGRLGTWLMKL